MAWGSSRAWMPVLRSAASAAAQGCIGSSFGFRSAARLIRYLAEAICQMPEKSGWPSGRWGAGAVRSTLPSLVRGMPAVGSFVHCAGATAAVRSKKAARDFTRLIIYLFAMIYS